MTPKDYSSISPSAQSLLLLKGYTNIPYARETAALMQGPEVFGLNFNDKDFWFWMRVLHFESRYWSIDQLLKATGSTNILELSSGYSWRGLDRCSKEAQLHYIDTDLPEVIAAKQQMMQQLHMGGTPKGRLELRPLNAVDPVAFRDTAGSFGDGPLTIVNEGLLMYLGPEEKEQLCRNIREALQQKGGCWITADIYVKRSDEMRVQLPQSSSEAAFFEQHNIEANKFDSYAAAETFFRAQGFELVQEAVPDYAALSVMPQLMEALPESLRNSKEPPPKVQATWMLKAI